MKSAIKAIYDKLYPEERGILINSEYCEINRRIQEEKEYLLSKLSCDDHKRFDKLESLYTSASDIDEAESFCRGFKLATLLMSEVYS